MLINGGSIYQTLSGTIKAPRTCSVLLMFINLNIIKLKGTTLEVHTISGHEVPRGKGEPMPWLSKPQTSDIESYDVQSCVVCQYTNT